MLSLPMRRILSPHFGFLHGLNTWTFPLELSSNTTSRSFWKLLDNWSCKWPRVTENNWKGNNQVQLPDWKLGHGQENIRLYWPLTDFQIWCLVQGQPRSKVSHLTATCKMRDLGTRLVQGFTTKGSFVRLLYKLILAHSQSPQPNLGLEF